MSKDIVNCEDLDDPTDPSDRYMKKAIDSLCEILEINDSDDSYREGVFLIGERKNEENDSNDITRYINISNASRGSIQAFVNILFDSLKKQEVIDLFFNFVQRNKSEIRTMIEDDDIEAPEALEEYLDE